MNIAPIKTEGFYVYDTFFKSHIMEKAAQKKSEATKARNAKKQAESQNN